ncbi:MAG TPA: hypothetical protein PKD72_07180 [Gemmatales bacterium]|nr:hypothetical protein [Gemmatales bacterium]
MSETFLRMLVLIVVGVSLLCVTGCGGGDKIILPTATKFVEPKTIID